MRPAPYDFDAAYEKKQAEHSSTFLRNKKVIDTSPVRIASNKYETYSLTKVLRRKQSEQAEVENETSG